MTLGVMGIFVWFLAKFAQEGSEKYCTERHAAQAAQPGSVDLDTWMDGCVVDHDAFLVTMLSIVASVLK